MISGCKDNAEFPSEDLTKLHEIESRIHQLMKHDLNKDFFEHANDVLKYYTVEEQNLFWQHRRPVEQTVEEDEVSKKKSCFHCTVS